MGLLVSPYYLYPAAVFVYFVVASTHSVCTLQSLKVAKPDKPKAGWLSLQSLLLVFASTYLAQLVSILVFSVLQGSWIEGEDDNLIVSLLACFLVFSLQNVSLRDAEEEVWYPYVGSWLLALALEPALAALSFLTGRIKGPAHFNVVWIVVLAVRYVVLVSMVSLYFAQRYASRAPPSSDEERQSLLPRANSTDRLGSSGSSENSENSYGSTLEEGQEGQEGQEQTGTPEYPWEERERKAREQMEKRLLEQGNWLTYVKRFKVWHLAGIDEGEID